jgi:hypothetical protein
MAAVRVEAERAVATRPQRSLIEHRSIRAISSSACHMAGSSRTLVRRPATVTLRFLSVLGMHPPPFQKRRESTRHNYRW